MWNSEYKSLQGNMGLGAAIAYFSSIGVPILMPLNDTQKYDLVVDLNGSLKRVQIKTCCYKAPSGNFAIGLKNSGGSSGIAKTRHFNNINSELVFVLLSSGDMLLIPSSEIDSKSMFTITQERLAKYKVDLSSWVL